jgi:phenylalanyl-tRNA synthetase beta chain
MIIHEKILKKYLSLNDYSLKELQFLINNHITEIDKCEILEPNDFLIIGKIIEFKKVPNSEKLHVVTVDIKDNHLTIICGASNLEKDKKVVVALIGAYLKSIKLHIEEKDIFGHKSSGMICSAQELGLDPNILSEEEKKGILILENDAPVGENALEYLNLKGFLFKLNITSDRGDLLSYIGFAEDLKSLNSINRLDYPISLTKKTKKEENPFQIQIINKNCWEYNLLYIKNIKVKKSPLWLRSLLLNHNIIPVNNIVDITNLVLLEYGIPLDVFDVSNFKEKKIEIRNSSEKEFIQIDSEKKIFLSKEDVVVASGQNILSILGIVNSYSNNINKDTNEIIITTSYLAPSYILKNSKKINLENEKKIRWTRGIDSSLVKEALNRFDFLLKPLNEECQISNILSQKIKNNKKPEILLSLKFVEEKIGSFFSSEEIENCLKKLDYEVEILKNDIFKLKPPFRRHDVVIPEDVCSDIIRIYGINKLKLPSLKKNKISLRNKKQETLYKLKDLLTNLGLYEIITYSLVNLKNLKLFSDQQDYIQVAKPISHENTILRQHLSGSMIEVLSYNQKHNNYDNLFFETAKVYNNQEEKLHLSIGLSGNLNSLGWIKPNIVSSFFVLKGILDKISLLLGIKFDLQQTTLYSIFHPGKQANILYKNKKIGFIGEIHPSVQKLYNLKESFLLEIALENEFLENSKNIVFNEISKLPSIIRDLSFFISKKYSFEEIFKTLKQEISDILIKCELLDLYEDHRLNTEEYSLSFRFTFNDKNKSLSKGVVNEIMKKIEDKMQEIYGIKLR